MVNGALFHFYIKKQIMKFIKQLEHPIVFIIFAWILLTAININKAYHIDDTFHLEAAECVGQHPLQPMSGTINWDSSPTPMYQHNQPPLFFYVIRIYQKFFGNGEIAQHLLLSVFVFLALLFFYKLTRFLEVTSPVRLLSIFAFCPAFVVNQNLMTDIPILALSLGIMYYLIKGQSSDKMLHYLLAAILLSIGLLIKYSLLPLFLVILITIFASRSYKKSVVLLVPLLTVTAWSIWNFHEFGAIHLASRPTSGFDIKNIVAFGGTLGAMSIFTFVFIYSVFPKALSRKLIVSIFGLLFIAVPLVYFNIIEESVFNIVLNYLFIINGFILIAILKQQSIKAFIENKYEYLKTPYFVIIIYILGVSGFIALFAPFNATRHVLLLIPFILLFGHKLFEKTRGIINTLVISASIILGILLGISDWLYADFYRAKAKEIKVSNNKIWSLGHWGWQWYSKKAGMQIYSKENDLEIINGDTVVFPKNIGKQELSKDIQLDTLSFITETPTVLTFFSGKNFASMYNSFIDKPAWSLSNASIDTIFVCKVKKEIGVDELIIRMRRDENLMNEIKNKATNRNISLDSMLVLDAQWILNENRKNRR